MTPMRFFHRTTEAAAKAILCGGFIDHTGWYMVPHETTGVWLSNVPVDANEGASGDSLFEILMEIDEEEARQYEWIEKGKPYREWQMPAAMINAKSKVRLLTWDEEDALEIQPNDCHRAYHGDLHWSDFPANVSVADMLQAMIKHDPGMPDVAVWRLGAIVGIVRKGEDGVPVAMVF